MRIGMLNAFKELYKVEKSNVELSDEIQYGLAKDVKYDNLTDKLCVAIFNYFIKCNPEVTIDVPKKRIKSPESIHQKSKSREIERLSKLYIIKGISKAETNELYKLIEERIKESEELEEEKVLKSIRELLEGNIEQINIQEFLDNIMVEGISNNTKKALLIILRSKIEKSNIPYKKQIIRTLDGKYGKKAAEKSGVPEDNIIRYETIEEIRANQTRTNLLYNKIAYLKSEDLIGTKIVISDVPDNASNKKIKELLALRAKAKTENEKIKYTDMAMKILSQDFIEKLTTDKEFLESMGIEVIPYSLKHKKKTNGYEADHVKFRFKSNPEYTLELQVRSKYVEELAKGNGSASHENRPGKQRNLPKLSQASKFKSEIEHKVPKYTLFEMHDGKFGKVKKCNMCENIAKYYENEMTPEIYELISNTLLECQEI